MHKPLVSRKRRLQAAGIQNPSGQWLALVRYGLFLESWHARCNIVFEAGVLEIRAVSCFISLTLVKINLFQCKSAICTLQSCLFAWPLLQTNILSWAADHNFAIIQSVLAQDSIQVFLSCLFVFDLSRCQLATRNTTSMAVLTWLTSWRGTLLILLAGNVSGHHPSSIVWSGTMDPTTWMSRILQMSAV